MTIDELIGYLEDYRDELGGDAEVRLMTQQNCPMEYAICGLASRVDMDEQIEDAAKADTDFMDETESDATIPSVGRFDHSESATILLRECSREISAFHFDCWVTLRKLYRHPWPRITR